MAASLNPSTLSRLRDLADMLGNINAEVAMLEEQAGAIKAELAASGEKTIVGALFKAEVVVSERNSLDPKATKALLERLGIEPPMKSTFVQSVRVKSLG